MENSGDAWLKKELQFLLSAVANYDGQGPLRGEVLEKLRFLLGEEAFKEALANWGLRRKIRTGDGL